MARNLRTFLLRGLAIAWLVLGLVMMSILIRSYPSWMHRDLGASPLSPLMTALLAAFGPIQATIYLLAVFPGIPAAAALLWLKEWARKTLLALSVVGLTWQLYFHVCLWFIAFEDQHELWLKYASETRRPEPTLLNTSGFWLVDALCWAAPFALSCALLLRRISHRKAGLLERAA